MSWLQEFKAFALRGNMVDLAIGVVIGAASTKVVNSLVNDIIMPPIGVLVGGVDFSDLSLKLPSFKETPVEIKYGAFINNIIDLLIIAAVIFLVVKLMNRLYKKEEAPTPTKECPECAMSIPMQAKRCGHCGTVLHTSTRQS